MKILVAADGSPYTRRMLDYLASHSEFLDGHQEYVVLNVVAPVPARAASSLSRELLQTYQEEEAEKVFKPIRSFFKKQGANAQFISKMGHASEIIGKTATAGKFDLLVLGSRGHGTLGSLLMGSVAAKVLGYCATPVLLVR